MPAFLEWIGQVGLAHCAQALRKGGIDFDIAPTLTENDLRDLGLNLGDTRRLLQALSQLGQGSAPSTESATVLEPPSKPHVPPDERRQLTVMFCDIVNYTELAERLDPEELKGIVGDYWGACTKVVESYDGYVAQYLGDGVMAYFGWPNAHEDDAERCVRAALDIVPSIRSLGLAEKLAVHIGIATGPMMVGASSRDGSAEDGLAVGETTIRAERLQGLAGADEITIEPVTRRLIGSAFELADIGTHALKGILQPVQAWKVCAVRRTEGRFDAAHGGTPLTALVGRDDELAQLLRRWKWAHDGEGRIVLLSGQPGIGKSRLTEVLRERIKGEPHTTLRYQCSPFRLNSALYPIIEHIEFAAGFAREHTPAQKLDKLEAMLAGSEEQRTESAPLFAALLSLPTDRYPSPGFSPRKHKERTLEALVREVEALSRVQPLLIVFEDAHWIDPTSQELLDLLMPQLRTMRVLMVITHRPEYKAHGREYPHVDTIELKELPKQLGGELVGKVTQGKALPLQVVDWIVRHAGGTPLFIEELTRSLLESRFLREEKDTYRLVEPLPAVDIPDEGLIPERLRAFLIERLGRRAKVRELAQIGACIGREFPYQLLAAVSPYKGGEFEEELQRLTETGLVFRRGTPPDVTYTFKHALVQDTAYELLPRRKRTQTHAQIAKVLETTFQDRVTNAPEVLAHHHTRAGHLTDAIPLWRSAGELAFARFALQEAVAHHEKGLAIVDRLPPSVERDGLELSLRKPLHTARLQWHGWAAPEVGVNAEAIVRLEESRERPESLLIGLWGKWVNTLTQGRVAEALPWADRLLAEGGKREDIDMQILGHRGSMFSHFYLGELHEARDHGEKTSALYDQDQSRAEQWIDLVGNDVRTSVGVCTSQALWMLGYPDLAADVSNRKDDHARKLRHPFDICWALTWGAYVLDYRREPQLLLKRADESGRLAVEQSIPVFYNALVPVGRGLAKLRMHELDQLRQGIEGPTAHDRHLLDESITQLRQGIEGWTARGGHLNVPYMKSALAEALAWQGEVDAALGLIAECLEQIERPGWNERVWLPEVLRLKGWMLIRQGKLAEAENALSESIGSARSQKARSWELRSSTTLAELLIETGRRDAARDLLAPIYNWFTEGLETHDLKAARSLLDKLA